MRQGIYAKLPTMLPKGQTIMIKFLYARLSEPSTWRGIIALLTAAGIALSPEQVEAIIVAGLGLIGIAGAFFPDKVKAA